jgi:hypothetical protein
VMDLLERIGVDRLMDGRLRAAGLMSKSGILVEATPAQRGRG